MILLGEHLGFRASGLERVRGTLLYIDASGLGDVVHCTVSFVMPWVYRKAGGCLLRNTTTRTYCSFGRVVAL
jgi:hypothetical protein